ncbi:MAG: NAD-dependent epimerase/dehydratase family protein [Chloroflexi bacterium]|nr:NAD-dependent epimerase/dehydratase family protein [Chloroflexota bacterium]MDA1147336.1 NAD-dependent epimerase/dehydratase family protein [Chloroflexota bacterium]
MKVAVTGGTGFVGSHTVEALLNAGHEVRLLVRDPARIGPAFEPLGVDAIEDVIVGDVTSPIDVEALLQGCDAVVHAASIFSLDTRDVAAIRQTNVVGTKHVTETARRLDLDPIVHVSSVTALIPSDGPVGPQTPPTDRPSGVYGQSKADSEALAREHQAAGAPVVSVMPGLVWGPHDPHFGESNRIASDFLRGRLRMVPRGGSIGIVDVRDVATALANTIEVGLGPRRYTLAPYHLALTDLAAHLNRATGRRIRIVALPDGLVWALVAPTGPLQRLLPVRLPFNPEAIRSVLDFVAVNSSRAAEELAITWHSLDRTFADTITSMVEHGQLEAKHAGSLARR